MASRTTLTIVFGYAAAFWCFQLLGEAEKKKNIQATPTPQSTFPRLAAAALLPAVVTTFGLTSLLLCAYVRALSRADAVAAAGAARRRLVIVDRLASATLGAATAALLAGAVLWLVADDGILGGGGVDNAGWFNTE